jgi:hypothetical protein
MRKAITLLLACTTFAFVASPGALAARNPNPEGGKPTQSCQELNPVSPEANPYAPGKAQESGGSPFNEAGENSELGGTGGQHYNENSQYDVACYQHQQKAETGR